MTDITPEPELRKAMLCKMHEAIERNGNSPAWLAMSMPAWKLFKSAVPRNQYRKRVGTRFVNAYRGLPISLHDEWAYGWDIIPRVVKK